MSTLPADFKKALAANKKATAQWKTLTAISQRDFISWITSAKQEATRKKRVMVACDKLQKGMRRPCCYSVVPLDFYSVLNELPKAKAAWKELTPDQKRDFTDWMNDPKDKGEKTKRVEKAGVLLLRGKKKPV